MATIRKIYRTGSCTVLSLPKQQLEVCGLDIGFRVVCEVQTPRGFLRSLGVAEGVIGAMDLSDMHFLIVRPLVSSDQVRQEGPAVE